VIEQPAALVMEFVDGETLAQRIARSPLPVDDALPIARQIAAGLETAHQRGIVHRDLKPANVMLTGAGAVKVLDFGLAKALDPLAEATATPAAMADSPTFTSPATQMGVVLGTAAYMAPEQAKGRPVDRRVDVWAFGCVFYEMLTGRRPFAGDDVTEVIAAIMRDEPDWTRLPRGREAWCRGRRRRVERAVEGQTHVAHILDPLSRVLLEAALQVSLDDRRHRSSIVRVRGRASRRQVRYPHARDRRNAADGGGGRPRESRRRG
jgi:serine/threonine protein kinase